MAFDFLGGLGSLGSDLADLSSSALKGLEDFGGSVASGVGNLFSFDPAITPTANQFSSPIGPAFEEADQYASPIGPVPGNPGGTFPFAGGPEEVFPFAGGPEGFTAAPRPGAVGTPPTGGFGQTVKSLAGPVSSVLGAGALLGQIPLALAGLSVARQGQRAQQSAIETEQAAARPAIQAEQTLLPAGVEALTSGQLPPQLQAEVEVQLNDARQALLQNLLNQGISPQTAEAMIAGQLQQLRTRLTTEYAQSLLGGGAGAASTGVSAGGVTGQVGGQLFGTAAQAVTGASQSLARLLAS